MPSGVGVVVTFFSPQYAEQGRPTRKPAGGLALVCTRLYDSSSPVTAEAPRLLGTLSAEVLARSVLPWTRYCAKPVLNAVDAWATVPVASTYRLLVGTSVTLKPWDPSHDLTVPTWVLLGANRFRNWAAVRNLPVEPEPRVETAAASFSAAAASRQGR